MKLGISTKLFLGIFMTTLLVVITLIVLIDLGFESGLLRLINQQESERVERLVQGLEEIADEQGDLSQLEDNHRAWRDLVDLYVADRPPRKPRDRNSRDRHDDDRRPAKKHADRGKDHKRPPPPPRNGRAPLDSIERTLALFDADKRHVMGSPKRNEREMMFPIETTSNGERITVGYLSYTPRLEIPEGQELDFAQAQSKYLYWLGLLTLLLSGLSAILFARHFLKPIKAIAQGAQQLAAGSFDGKVKKYSNDELGQLCEDFNHLATTLNANQQSRQQWIADISHELRTPITILNGEIEALIDGARETTPEAIASLNDEVKRLSRLVDDLYSLSLSDIGALSYNMQAIELVDFIEHCLDTFTSRFTGKGLRVKLVKPESDQALVIHADEVRLAQMISNLFENSARYTDSGGQLVISLFKEGNVAKLQLEDSSPAVAATDLPFLFERLYRAERSRNRKTGGAGLGLSIVSNIVAAHRGTVQASLSTLGGIKIEIQIPLMVI